MSDKLSNISEANDEVQNAEVSSSSVAEGASGIRDPRQNRILPVEKPQKSRKAKGAGFSLSIGDSEDAEEYTERRASLPSLAAQTVASRSSSQGLSESEDAEESRFDKTVEPESAEEFSYMGGGRSESGVIRTSASRGGATGGSATTGTTGGGGFFAHRSGGDKSETTRDETRDFSEDVSRDEMMPHSSSSKLYAGAYEESTDAESASESEVAFAKEA